MTFYKKDYRMMEAIKCLQEMQGNEGDLMRYMMQKKDEYIEELRQDIKEMREVFDGIAKFTYKDHNPRIG